MLNKIDLILADALLKEGKITEETLNSLTKKAEESKQEFKSLLIEERITEKTILKVLAERLNLTYLNLKEITLDRSLVDKIPAKVSFYYRFIPLGIEDEKLSIAVSYPLTAQVQDEVKMYLGYRVKQNLSCEREILEKLKLFYGLGAETIQEITRERAKEEPEVIETEEKVEDLEKLAGGASVVKLVNQIILDACRKRATDIHIEPYREKVKLRYRIDGVLSEAPVPPQIKNFLRPILSRIKIMSNLDIVEHRLPQDGRAIIKIGKQTLNLRISCLPTPFGESVVIRILPLQLIFDLEKLGLSSSDLKLFEGLIKRPHGIIFVTGPTGSGKTTTLYTALNKLNTNDRKIITIEDPIEYEMENISQIQVAPQIGLDFARGLRSMLRHDPDVMMVGEVRDAETAEIAIRVALTGHLIVSSLHTNDAAGSITRLMNMGVEPYLITSSVVAVMAQRLVKLICPKCRRKQDSELTEVGPLIAKDLGISNSEVKIYRGEGCRNCNFTGYYERTAIYEIMVLNEEIRELILKKSSSARIKSVALKNGMHTLRQNGWQKVIEGLTTVEEVFKVTQEEEENERIFS